jgi:nucleoside-diphosphate-sugar epimerase
VTRGLEVLVTGAGGFVGSSLCPALVRAGYVVRSATRSLPGAGPGPPAFAVGDIGPETDWAPALSGVACVVHLAARTHVLREAAADPLAEYRRTNVAATRRLAQQAAKAGVHRLVYLSSVKVNGESTSGRPYTEDDSPAPEDAYGVSKWEAEQELRQLAAVTGVEIVVLRPPLVYGPRVKGNFLRLIALIARGAPLPFASLENRRSLIYVGNLADAIIAAIGAPQAAGRTYLVSDGEDISTPGLVRALARALGVKERLFACPRPVLRAAAALLGRTDELARLAGSLQIDSSRIRRELAWRPRSTLADGLADTARWYHARAGA